MRNIIFLVADIAQNDFLICQIHVFQLDINNGLSQGNGQNEYQTAGYPES